MKKRSSLRPDTTLAPVEEPKAEVYVWSLPSCCLQALKEAALAEAGERRRLELGCSCGRTWRVTSSLDERILGQFVTHGGPRVGGSPRRRDREVSGYGRQASAKNLKLKSET